MIRLSHFVASSLSFADHSWASGTETFSVVRSIVRAESSPHQSPLW